MKFTGVPPAPIAHPVEFGFVFRHNGLAAFGQEYGFDAYSRINEAATSMFVSSSAIILIGSPSESYILDTVQYW